MCVVEEGSLTKLSSGGILKLLGPETSEIIYQQNCQQLKGMFATLSPRVNIAVME